MPVILKPDYSPYSSVPYGNALALVKLARSGAILENKAEIYGHAFVIQGWIGATGILEGGGPVPILGYDESDVPDIDDLDLDDLCAYCEELASPPEDVDIQQGLFDSLFARVATKLVARLLQEILDGLFENLGGE